MVLVMVETRRSYRSRLKRRETRIGLVVRSKSKETTRRIKIRRRKLNYRSMLERFILSSQSSSSPPPPPPAEDSKSVCIIAIIFSKNTTYSFKFDPDQSSSLSIDDSSNGVGVGVGGGELNHRILSPTSGTCKINMNTWEGTCYAAIGSTMYWFGGDEVEIDGDEDDEIDPESNFPEDEITDPQSNFPEYGWKHGPPMIVPHMSGDYHNKTVIDGKLYVFGGRGFIDLEGPWGEFFDPIKNRWEALPDPPVLLDQPTTSVFDKKILVGLCESGEFYGYDTVTNTWSLLLLSRSRIHTKPGIFGKAVRVNNTLYSFNQSRLLLDAYDLDRRVWFVGYFEHLKLDGLVYFFHLGGDDENFCVLWDNNRLDSESGLECINFVKFRVTKRITDDHVEGGEGVLDMHIQSSQMFLMDSRLIIQDVVMST